MGWGGLPLPARCGSLQGLAGHAACVGLLWALVMAPALAQGLSAEADALAPHLLTVPGEAMLIDPPPPPPLPPPGAGICRLLARFDSDDDSLGGGFSPSQILQMFANN